MTPIQPVTMQSLSARLGTELAIRSCAPVAFYMLLRANGYLHPDLTPDEFVFSLDRSKLSTNYANPNNWSRPALSEYLRAHFGAGIVSWQLHLNGQPDYDRMKQSGYLKTPTEVDFYARQVKDKSLSDIVRSGYPVIVTVLPGFSTPGNESVHAVIITYWDQDKVEIIDPDARNPNHTYAPDIFKNYISPNGAGSIVLPKP